MTRAIVSDERVNTINSPSHKDSLRIPATAYSPPQLHPVHQHPYIKPLIS